MDVMELLGVGVWVEPDVGVGGLLEGYRDVFERLSACTGGAVAITDVELVDGDDEEMERVRMLVNGRDFDWHVEHDDDRDYLDTLSIYEISTVLAPEGDTDTREFIDLLKATGELCFVFTDRAVFSALADELGIELE